MPLRVPPRAIAAEIRLQAATRAGWVLAALVLIEHAIVTVEYFVRAGQPEQMVLPLLPMACLAIMLAVLAVAPGWMTALAYLVVGAMAITVHLAQMVALGVDPARMVIVSTMGTAVALVGAASGGALGGVIWTGFGILVTQLAVLGTQIIVGIPLAVDNYAAIIGSLYLVTYLLMWRSDRVQRRLVDTEPIEAEVEREENERQRERRAAVVVHETVLRDLALIAHGPLSLTDHDRARLRRDLDEIAAWQSPTSPDAPEPAQRGDFYDIIREFQWCGLSVDVGGNAYLIDSLEHEGREALLGAVRAALDNVFEHSGRSTAEVFIDNDVDRLTVMVVDDGQGFDLAAVAEDRLGLRMAIMRRIEDQGGTVTVWSSPGAGASVVMSLPVSSVGGVYS